MAGMSTVAIERYAKKRGITFHDACRELGRRKKRKGKSGSRKAQELSREELLAQRADLRAEEEAEERIGWWNQS